MQNLYKYYQYTAKAKYHNEMSHVLTNQYDNETDPMVRKRICARRSHHRRMYRKYHVMAESELNGKR